jgi:hypothetical protein
MSNSGVLVPDDLNKALNERAEIWRGLDAARANMDKINSHVSKVGENMGAAPIAPLTQQSTPPTEIFHALQQVEGEVSAINQAEQKIQEFSAEIERLKAQIRQRYIIAIGAFATVLVILLCWLMQLL